MTPTDLLSVAAACTVGQWLFGRLRWAQFRIESWWQDRREAARLGLTRNPGETIDAFSDRVTEARFPAHAWLIQREGLYFVPPGAWVASRESAHKFDRKCAAETVAAFHGGTVVEDRWKP